MVTLSAYQFPELANISQTGARLCGPSLPRKADGPAESRRPRSSLHRRLGERRTMRRSVRRGRVAQHVEAPPARWRGNHRVLLAPPGRSSPCSRRSCAYIAGMFPDRLSTRLAAMKRNPRAGWSLEDVSTLCKELAGSRFSVPDPEAACCAISHRRAEAFSDTSRRPALEAALHHALPSAGREHGGRAVNTKGYVAEVRTLEPRLGGRVRRFRAWPHGLRRGRRMPGDCAAQPRGMRSFAGWRPQMQQA